MKLLPNEEIITSLYIDKLTVTNQRVIFKNIEWGQSSSFSVFLENISTIETKYKHYPILILLAIIFIFGGFIVGNDTVAAGIVLGLISIFIWFSTRKFTICISSNGGSSININIGDEPEDAVNNLLFSISNAKLSRINQLHKV